MQEYCESHAGNSFISCCSVFSKNNKQVIIQPQTCNIVINNRDLSIFYGIRVKINIFVHFDISKLDGFVSFLIKSYTFVKSNSNIASKPPTDDCLLDTLIYNLQKSENDNLENQSNSNNNLFTLEILDRRVVIKEKNEGEESPLKKTKEIFGMKLSLIFTNHFIANYYFNRFEKVITLDKQEYKILILPLDCEMINPNLKRIQTTVLDSREYILYQISKQISNYGNKINGININKNIYYKELQDQDKYYVLFHPNSIIDPEYNKNYHQDQDKNFIDTFKSISFIKHDENNHNIHWFVAESNMEEKYFIRCFRFNLITINHKLNTGSNRESFIKYEKSKEEIVKESKKNKDDVNRKEQRIKNNKIRDNENINKILRINNQSTIDSFIGKPRLEQVKKRSVDDPVAVISKLPTTEVKPATRCFICKKIGHSSKDCVTINQ